MIALSNMIDPRPQVQTMMESFDVNKLLMQPDACLPLFASGRTTGIAVDIGDFAARTLPSYEGYGIECEARSSTMLGGRNLTEQFANSLKQTLFWVILMKCLYVESNGNIGAE